MLCVTQEKLNNLGYIILKYLQEEFDIKHLSGNLLNTIKIEISENNVKIIIPAQTYNMLLYQTKGVVVHYGSESYASKLDEQGSEFYVYPNGVRKGSFLAKPHNHKGYVDEVLKKALQEWASQNQVFISNKVG